MRKYQNELKRQSLLTFAPSSRASLAGDLMGVKPISSAFSSSALAKNLRLEHFKATALAVWWNALVPCLITRVILVTIGLFANFYIMPLMVTNPVLPSHEIYGQFPQAFWLMWQRFDSGFYLTMAKHGYDPASMLHIHSNWAFFPLYPLLMAQFARLFGGSYTALSIAGIIISNLSALVAVTYLYLLVRREFNELVAGRTVLYFLLFPMSFYLSAVYPEALFMAFTLAAIYYARQQSWWQAGICAGIASAARVQGVLLIVPLAWEYLRVTSERYMPMPMSRGGEYRDLTLPRLLSSRVTTYTLGLWRAAHDFKNWLMAGFLIVTPTGLLAFMLYAQVQTGDFMATFHNEQWGWKRQLSYPWRLLIYSLRHPIMGEPMNWNFWICNIVLAFIFLAIMLWAFRRLPMIYAIYTALMVILPLTANFLNSVGRYYLLVFPAFLLLALWSCNDKRPIHSTIIAGFAALQAIFMIFYVLGLPIIA